MTAYQAVVEGPDGFRLPVTVTADTPAAAKAQALADVAFRWMRPPESLRVVTCVAEPPGLDGCVAELVDGWDAA